MSQIVASAELAQQLAAATGPVQIVNEQGTTLAVCMPVNRDRSRPYTPEEIEIRRRQVAETREEFRTHPEKFKTLRQIMEELHRKVGDNH